MEVTVRNDDIEGAIHRFKKKVEGSGLFLEIKRATFFETRTQRRKRKDRIAAKRRKTQMARRRVLEGFGG